MTIGDFAERLRPQHPTPLVFLDESGAIANDRFFVVGVLKLERPSVLLRRIQRFRDREQWHTEFHFSKVTKGQLGLYKRLVDILVRADDLSFDCFVADRVTANPIDRYGTH